jgi:GNAT superfamily N-acetyltransferase
MRRDNSRDCTMRAWPGHASAIEAPAGPPRCLQSNWRVVCLLPHPWINRNWYHRTPGKPDVARRRWLDNGRNCWLAGITQQEVIFHEVSLTTSKVNTPADVYLACFTGPPRFEQVQHAEPVRLFERSLTSRSDFVLSLDSGLQIRGDAVGLPTVKSQFADELSALGVDPSSDDVEQLAVAPQCQNQGVGSRLRNRIIDQAGDGTPMTRRCHADAPNMIALLKSAGFQQTASCDATVGNSTANRYVFAKNPAE